MAGSFHKSVFFKPSKIVVEILKAFEDFRKLSDGLRNSINHSDLFGKLFGVLYTK